MSRVIFSLLSLTALLVSFVGEFGLIGEPSLDSVGLFLFPPISFSAEVCTKLESPSLVLAGHLLFFDLFDRRRLSHIERAGLLCPMQGSFLLFPGAP